MTSALLYMPVLVLGYLASSLGQFLLHRFLGHESIGGPLRRIHLGSHHRIFSGSHFVSDTYPDEQTLTPLFVVPAVVMLLTAYWALPLDLFVAATTSVLGTYALQTWLHAQYHLSTSRLRRFGWFRRLKALHVVHHYDPRANYGLTDFLADRLFGSFVDPERPKP